VSNRIPWGQEQQHAFDKLKSLLCDAITRPLSIIDSSIPFNVSVDASEYSVGGILTQTRDGNEQPVAFISAKLTPTQRRWSVIEKAESMPKSSKLLRWALALQEFVVELKYRCGRNKEAADCLSRMVFGGDEESPAA
jgi:RNase H-like domain found in reverse transcriptase